MLWVEFDFELSMDEIHKILKAADPDGNGQLDLSEFMDFYPQMKRMSWFKSAEKQKKEREKQKSTADPYSAGGYGDDTAEVASIAALVKSCSSLAACDELLKPKPPKPTPDAALPDIDVRLGPKCERRKCDECTMRGCGCDCHTEAEKTLFDKHVDAIMNELDVMKAGKIMRAEMYFALSHVARELDLKKSDRAHFFRSIDDDRSCSC